MIDIKKVKVGDRVHYTPYKNCPKNQIENGIIKEIPNYFNDKIRVVYNCNNEWDRYMDYTSALTDIIDLEYGWKEDNTIYIEHKEKEK